MVKVAIRLRKIILLFPLIFSIEIRAQIFYEDSIVWDVDTPLYFRNEMIIKFNPSLVDTSVINDKEKQVGYVYEFIHPVLLQMLIDSGHFNEDLANLTIKKIHHNMTTNDDTSISRLGHMIEIPAYWSTFLLTWNDLVGVSYLDAIDSLKKMWPFVEYVHPNYVIGLTTGTFDPKFHDDFEQAGLASMGGYNNVNINVVPA